jgi:carbohydrate binding protein with CBM4/9 domain
MSTPTGYTVGSPGLRERLASVSRPEARHAVLALTIGCIVALAILKADGSGSHIVSDAIAGIFAVSFLALALIDFRASVAVTIFELVLSGAGGHWIDHGSLTGRIFLIAVVTLRAAWLTVVDWRRGRRPVLGRYGAHALAIAILVPAIWMPLGLANGNLRSNVVADGNGFFFFAFVLVVVTLLRRGDGAWLQRVFFAACAASAAAYFLLIVVTTSGLVSLDSVTEWLTVRLNMGGVIGYMPNGQYRLFTAGSLFLVVGLVLTAQQLLARPRSPLLWLLAGLLSVDLVATYTRGLWLAAFVAVVLVLVLEAHNVRELGLAVAIPAAAGGLALVVAPVAGFSLYGYVANRAATVTAASHNSYPTRVANPSFEAASGAWQVTRVSSLRVMRTASVAHTESHSLEMSNSAADEDAYAFQNLSVKPKTTYSVSAWVNARAFRQPAAAERGLLLWDAQDGLLYTVPLTTRTNGWRRLSFTFPTKADAKDVQLRLYAPQGRVLWDGIHLARGGPAAASARAAGSGVLVNTVPASGAAQTMALQSTASGQADAAGEASNAYRIAEAKSLLRYIRKRPLYGWGFGSVASDFSTSYSYELSYLDLLFKTGILGLLLYLSFPVRLIVDALRLRGRRASTTHYDARGIGSPGVVVGVVVGILLAGGTNPYLFAAFGLVSFFVMAAWLEEARRVTGPARES